MIDITAERYAQLLRAEKKLIALENGGVDNWEWYGEALSDFYAEEEESE